MRRRKIEDEREARTLLAKAAKAGGDLGSFARAHGVDGRSLNAWRINLERRGQLEAPPGGPGASDAPLRLVELVPTVRSMGSARYTVRLGGAEVEVGDDFQADTLRRLLEVLRSC